MENALLEAVDPDPHGKYDHPEIAPFAALVGINALGKPVLMRLKISYPTGTLCCAVVGNCHGVCV